MGINFLSGIRLTALRVKSIRAEMLGSPFFDGKSGGDGLYSTGSFILDVKSYTGQAIKTACRKLDIGLFIAYGMAKQLGPKFMRGSDSLTTNGVRLFNVVMPHTQIPLPAGTRLPAAIDQFNNCLALRIEPMVDTFVKRITDSKGHENRISISVHVDHKYQVRIGFLAFTERSGMTEIDLPGAPHVNFTLIPK